METEKERTTRKGSGKLKVGVECQERNEKTAKATFWVERESDADFSFKKDPGAVLAL